MSADLREAYANKVKQQVTESKVQSLQKVFQAGSEPVFAKTVFDKKYVRFIMPASYVAIGASVAMLLYVAAGKMKKQ